MAEGFAEGLRNGTFKFSETEGRKLVNAMRDMLTPSPIENVCTITQACNYLCISQPTFRSYIKKGMLPAGQKYSGFSELLWDKKAIEAFAKQKKFSRIRKVASP